MASIRHLLERNREWAAAVEARTPGFFARLAAQQAPRYLWIGCSDSRVPANEIVDLAPGELFVHRNVANVVVHTDFNCLSVLQYALDVLKVEHVIVVGHYGCGGVRAALDGAAHGLIDNWLQHVRDVAAKHASILARISDPRKRADHLCELNVIEGVSHLARTTIVQAAWQRAQPVTLHGLVYGLEDGLLADIGIAADSMGALERDYASAVERLRTIADTDRRGASR
jgi:carbonic anhydrase